MIAPSPDYVHRYLKIINSPERACFCYTIEAYEESGIFSIDASFVIN